MASALRKTSLLPEFFTSHLIYRVINAPQRTKALKIFRLKNYLRVVFYFLTLIVFNDWYGIINATIFIIKLITMTLIGFLVLLAIAAICGAIGQSIAGYDLGGCLVSIVVGFIGAYLGMWLAGKMGLPEFFTINIQGKPFPIIWSVIGSALFTLIVVLIRKAVLGGKRY